MSGDPIDLDGIEDWALAERPGVRMNVEALVAEVRRLRAERSQVSGYPLDLDAIEAQANDARHVTFPNGALIIALVAAVRRLRAEVGPCDGCDAPRARCESAIDAGAIKCCPDCRHRGGTWPDGNPRVPGESFDDYNARMIEGINGIPDDQLARHPDGTLDTEPACWCNVPAMLAIMHCPRHLGYFP